MGYYTNLANICINICIYNYLLLWFSNIDTYFKYENLFFDTY